jgi:hypothetical protein
MCLCVKKIKIHTKTLIAVKRLIFLLFLCNSFLGYGQTTVAIEVTNMPSSVKPGQYFSVFLTVTSVQTLPSDFKNRLVLPDNWKILTEKKIAEDPLSTKYLFTVSTPNQAVSGDYSIDFQVVARDSVIYSQKKNLLIEAVRHVEITHLSQPEFVKEGDVLRIEYLIQNQGNKTERVKLETSRGIVENAKDSVEILPNSFRKVWVKQAIPKTDRGAWQAASDLKVSFQNAAIPIFQTVSVPVFSSKMLKNDPYFRLPIEVGGGYLHYTIGKKTVSAFQYLAEGKGYLDVSKRHFIDFLLRGPNQFTFPAIGNYDHYSVSYNYLSKTQITAGDYVLRFNNLMEFGRFGRGLKIEQAIGKNNLRVFYQQARFFPNQKDAFGSSYTVKLKGESNIGFQFMSKHLIDSKNAHFRSNLLGISAFVKKEAFNNDTEISLGHALSKFDVGLFNKFNWTHKRLTAHSEIIYTGKEFYGFYTNSLLLTNGINYHFTNRLNMGVNSNVSRVNPSLDVLKYSVSPYATTHTAFVAYQLNSKNLFSLNYTQQAREDRQTPSSFHYKEDFGNVSYNLNTSRFTAYAQARYGFAQNLKAIDSLAKNQSTAYWIQPAVAVLPNFWIGGYFEQQHTSKFSATNTPQNLYFYGGNLRLNYNQNINLNFMYRNNYAPDELFEQRSFMEGTLTFESERHKVSIMAGRFFIPNLPQNGENTLYFTARYTHKINVRLKKDKKLGYLKGQIIGMSEGIKKEGILLKIGQYKILSDSNGCFNFPSLMPNKYVISLSHETNLSGIVATIKTPIEVEIRADSTTSLTIPLIKTGGITGSVNFQKTAQDSTSTPSVKPVIYIKLVNENESLITQMTPENTFSFKEIKPGAWKLKAMIVGKSAQFELENPEIDVEIESGQIKQPHFLVKTMERKIKFSGKNFQLSSKK